MPTAGLQYVTGGNPTSSFLYYGYLGSIGFPLPEKTYVMARTKSQGSFDYLLDEYYSILTNQSLIRNQVEIIHNFASKIIEKTQDLDPRLSELVDKHFWKLV